MINMKKSPNVIFMKVTECCNLRCVQCDYHKNRDIDETTVEEKIRVLHQINEWDNSIRISFTGGEPFLRKDILYRLAQECKELGLASSVTTNGTLIRDEDISRVLDCNFDFVLVSIDSNVEDVHNYIRGNSNAFLKATTFSRNLIKMRNEVNSSTKVCVSTLLGKHNINDIEAIITFFEEIGFDGVFFQVIQPNFSSEFDEKWIEKSPLYPSPDEAKRGITKLIELKDKHGIIAQTKEQFEDMLIYFMNPFRLPFTKCEAMNSTIIINNNGETQFCFAMDRLGYKTCGNIKNCSLMDIWNKNKEIRRIMSKCTFGCGIMNCHYKEEK